MKNYSDEELSRELNSWEIEKKSGGFGSSYKTLYRTDYTTIAAKAFHIPNQQTGEVHHFDLSIRIFQRKRKSDNWTEKFNHSENEYGTHKQLDIKSGNGKAVAELAKFLNAQFTQVGKTLEQDTFIVDKPENVNFSLLLKNMSTIQKEEFGQGIRIETLKEYKEFLERNLDKNETFIQNWLDAEGGKYRKQRCLIFGIEFIDHKREGELSRKRFDILTRSSIIKNEYVIIELKSPCDDIFKIVETTSVHGGSSVEYHLSPEISRAIPQILRYKSIFENTSDDDDDLRRIGIKKGSVKKCIILLGKRNHADPIWEDHFQSLKNNFSNILEIWTYSDLIDKLEITIKNLEENLNYLELT
ncbi:MAG: hypothetical protein SCALA702_02120 [Melioribacteraceae bacterium]|nr:MAG: hypothetical protein SCALA702_02120 [Melioribacteraceae bacterium]